MKKILVISRTNPNVSPRPNRMVNWLKDQYEVEVVGISKLNIDGIQSYVIDPFRPPKNIRELLFILKRVAWRNINLLSRKYEEVNWSRLGNAKELVNELSRKKYDLIISHDLVLLPFVFMIKDEKTRVMLDAREYYPMNFDDQWLWRIQQKSVNEYLCREYLPRCDKIITVSDGLANEYARVFGVQCEVIMSLPSPRDVSPVQSQPNKFKIIHHGNASRSRRIELMIEMMDYVDDRFTLDLMMMSVDKRYLEKITEMARARKNVRVIPPVPMQEIVTTINQYDLGLFLVPPSNFNLKYTLPNKLFEFIQARLAVAIGPSIEMKKIVEKYDCGIVSDDFTPKAMADILNSLTIDKIMQLKRQSDRAAAKLNAQTNGRRINEIVRDLLEM
jgi:glycosyltransferase involved in cell wall biosynthesis